MRSSFRRYISGYVWLIFLLLFLQPAWSEECEQAVDIYFFHSSTCGHCKNLMPLMDAIDKLNPKIHVHKFEIHDNPDVWDKFRKEHGIVNAGVPRLFIGNLTFIGYTESEGKLEYFDAYDGYYGYKNQIVRSIEDELHKLDPDAVIYTDPDQSSISAANTVPDEYKVRYKFNSVSIFLLLVLYGLSYLFFLPKMKDEKVSRLWWGGFVAVLLLCIFIFIITTDETQIRGFAEKLPFPVFVVLLAFADGFNPCAFAVLIVLLSLLTYTKSRKDMLVIGSVFILTSSVMYFIFMMLIILSISFFTQYSDKVSLAIGVVLTVAGAINIKDFFFFGKGVSLGLSDDQKSRFSRKASGIVRKLKDAGNMKAFIAALAGTIVLAVFVNLLELGCTAIFPMAYSEVLLSSFGPSLTFNHVFWTSVYAVVYIIPLMAILANFIYSFSSTRLTESQGRMLKLLGGVFMLIFGIIMIFIPELLTLGQ